MSGEANGPAHPGRAVQPHDRAVAAGGRGDLRINGEGYKPSGDEWLAGGVGASSPLGVATKAKAPASAYLRYEDGKVMIDGDLIVDGNLRVNGTVTTRDFVKA